ncbi:MAG: glutamate--tRNA ligase [Alphaproteobacteria bacterium]|nr:glutamate--tRNA ligase [Alphaproteobacteria bacterium]
MSKVRTRFAPSPTGSLHVGGARTALYSWLYARKHGGEFILRIEDTDQVRSSDEAARGIIRDMKWLGLDWDEGPVVEGPHGPYYQSQRIHLYETHVRDLLDRDRAYQAWESRDELDAMRKEAEANKENFRFRRREPYTDAEMALFESEKRVPVVRLKAPSHAVTIEDVVVGDVTQTPDELEDVVIRKADGFPTYHFAVVVDDQDMRVTHVLRGSEHLMNTAKHLGILEALGWKAPVFGHLPIIFNMSGSKMSKRDKAKAAREGARNAAQARSAAKDDWAWLASPIGSDAESVLAFMKKKNDDVGMATAIASHLDVDLPMIEVMDFRQAGYLPEALLNYLALLGWSAGDDREYYTLPELAEAFELGRVNKQPAKFDPAKLQAMNFEWITKRIDETRYKQALKQWFEVVDSPLARLSDDALDTTLALFRPRAHTFVDLQRKSQFLRAAPVVYDASGVQKHIRQGAGLAHLSDVRAALSDVGRWENGSIQRAFERLCDQTGTKLGKYAPPVRIAICGATDGPGLYETLAALDRDDALARIDRAIGAWSAEQ